jgi:hypothetical protein
MSDTVVRVLKYYEEGRERCVRLADEDSLAEIAETLGLRRVVGNEEIFDKYFEIEYYAEEDGNLKLIRQQVAYPTKMPEKLDLSVIIDRKAFSAALNKIASLSNEQYPQIFLEVRRAKKGPRLFITATNGVIAASKHLSCEAPGFFGDNKIPCYAVANAKSLLEALKRLRVIPGNNLRLEASSEQLIIIVEEDADSEEALSREEPLTSVGEFSTEAVALYNLEALPRLIDFNIIRRPGAILSEATQKALYAANTCVAQDASRLYLSTLEIAPRRISACNLISAAVFECEEDFGLKAPVYLPLQAVQMLKDFWGTTYKTPAVFYALPEESQAVFCGADFFVQTRLFAVDKYPDLSLVSQEVKQGLQSFCVLDKVELLAGLKSHPRSNILGALDLGRQGDYYTLDISSTNANGEVFASVVPILKLANTRFMEWTLRLHPQTLFELASGFFTSQRLMLAFSRRGPLMLRGENSQSWACVLQEEVEEEDNNGEEKGLGLTDDADPALDA